MNMQDKIKRIDFFVCLACILLMFFSSCGNDKADGLTFYKGEKSIEYKMYRTGWKDTFSIHTRNYDSGIAFLEDKKRGDIIVFDNLHLIQKIESETGKLIDTVCIVCRYGKYKNTQKNKLLYAYPALFYYYDEVLVHLDMEFNVQAYYLDSISQVIDARYSNGYRYEMYIDSVRLMPPDKVWVRMNDEHGNIEVMIFGVNATMEAPVIYSTYIFR